MAHILITGAAGFIGGEVAARLVARGHTVTALVHKNTAVLGNDGRPANVSRIVRCNMTKPMLGLDAAEFAALAAGNALMIHTAATTRFDLEDYEYRAINVGGTGHALELAQAGGMAFLHVSTAYVCGERNGVILEDEPLPQAGFANGYEASKALAELMVESSGLHYAIARPSIVVGDSRDGAIRVFGAMYGLFKMVVEGRVRQVPARESASLDLVPIDHVAGGIVDLAEGIERASGVYHLVSGAPARVPDAVQTLSDYAHLRMPDLIDPDSFDRASLTSIERWAYDNALCHYAHYLRRDPCFDDRRFRAFAGRACPATDAAFLRRLIDYSIGAGFVKDRSRGRDGKAA